MMDFQNLSNIQDNNRLPHKVLQRTSSCPQCSRTPTVCVHAFDSLLHPFPLGPGSWGQTESSLRLQQLLLSLRGLMQTQQEPHHSLGQSKERKK